MRSTLPANSSRSDGNTYFLSPQMRRLRQSVGRPLAKRSWFRSRSAADSLTVSTVWKGRAILGGATLRPLSSYLPSQMSSVMQVDLPGENPFRGQPATRCVVTRSILPATSTGGRGTRRYDSDALADDLYVVRSVR